MACSSAGVNGMSAAGAVVVLGAGKVTVEAIGFGPGDAAALRIELRGLAEANELAQQRRPKDDRSGSKAGC
jgi:hypothetical protein